MKKHGKKILHLLQEINQKSATTILIITHNQGFAEMADWVVKMKSGELDSIFHNPSPVAAEMVKWV